MRSTLSRLLPGKRRDSSAESTDVDEPKAKAKKGKGTTRVGQKRRSHVSRLLDKVTKPPTDVTKDKNLGMRRNATKTGDTKVTDTATSGDESIVDESNPEEDVQTTGKYDGEMRDSSGPEPDSEPDPASTAETDDTDGAEEDRDPSDPNNVIKKLVASSQNVQVDAKQKQVFQFRIHIVEGKDLDGTNVHPVCKVFLGNQMRSTRVQHSTNFPRWNQSLYFGLNATLLELCEKSIVFKVFSARKIRKDALIGEHTVDLGMVYRLPQHCLINKWLVLTRDKDETASVDRLEEKATLGEPCGYLKVWFCIVGQGDVAPIYVPRSSEFEDTEDNMLYPSSVQYKPITLLVRIYTGQDLPTVTPGMLKKWLRGITFKRQKDVSDEDNVSPFVQVHIAGKCLRTKHVQFCSTPGFYTELRVPLKWPTVAKSVVLRLYDHYKVDRNEPIGYCEIPLNDIGRPGDNGFLPTFGPTFVSFYGSRRQSGVQKCINLGLLSGDAYHGRLLLELRCLENDDWLVQPEIYEMANDLMLKVKPRYQGHRHVLYCAFYTAGMIDESLSKDSVHFRVTIGCYGDATRVNHRPAIADTEAFRPLYDGTRYYYMPWSNRKPCCILPCQWESPTYRFEGSNLFANAALEFSTQLQRVQSMIGRNEESEIASEVIYLLDWLISYVGEDIPFPKEGTSAYALVTTLDEHLYNYRQYKRSELTRLAQDLRDSAVSVDEAVDLLQAFVNELKHLGQDPQLTEVPDIFIYMLANGKEVAYARIAARDVYYSMNARLRGKFSARYQSVFLQWPDKKGVTQKHLIPAHLHLKLWLGPSQYAGVWKHCLDGGETAFYVEIFENESKIMGKWTAAVGQPVWSDESMRFKIGKESVMLPAGFHWKGDWFPDPTYNMYLNEHSDKDVVVEEAYEQHQRTPEGLWDEAQVQYVDEDGSHVDSPHKVTCPEGWVWLDDWLIDYTLPVDAEGWEYSTTATFRRFDPAERSYHQYRRRRWKRQRGIAHSGDQERHRSDRAEKLLDKQGWQYGSSFSGTFHTKQRRSDQVRRRRWHRRMISSNDLHSNQLTYDNIALRIQDIDRRIKRGDTFDPEIPQFSRYSLPRVYIKYPAINAWQLRAYIFQGCDLLPMHRNGLSNAVVRVTFINQTQETFVVGESLNPVWDQTLMFKRSYIPGIPERIKAHPLDAVVEVFDHAEVGDWPLLGRFVLAPQVRPRYDNMALPAENVKLTWYPLQLHGKTRGEILAALELYESDEHFHYVPHLPPVKELLGKKQLKIYQVPSGIRPVYEKVWVEFLCWGVRNLKRFELIKIKAPYVQLQFGTQCKQTDTIRNTTENPNFPNPLMRFETDMPTDLQYMTPMTICMYDTRSFGRKPLVGVCVVKDFQRYLKKMPTNFQSTPNWQEALKLTPQKFAPPDPPKAPWEPELDWWSKFYYSLGDKDKARGYEEKGLAGLEVFSCPVESMPTFEGFEDFCETFTFRKVERGKWKKSDETEAIGELKGRLHIYRNPSEKLKVSDVNQAFHLQFVRPERCVLRVYIVRAMSLSSCNRRGSADPYVQIKCGKHTISGRKQYVAETLNPQFGQVYELQVNIPQDKELRVCVRDRNALGFDDDIGETKIDLENRLLTMWRATCPLAKQFCTSGINVWRDQQTPKEILATYCDMFRLPKPVYDDVGRRLQLGSFAFTLDQFERAKLRALNKDLGSDDERMALYALHMLRLVPEHVETRPLFNRTNPEVEQGKLQLWLDLFPLSLGPPSPPVDISLRKPRSFQLRLVVWSARDVALEKYSFGEWTADIYVKCYVAGLHKQAQRTDVHYRSVDGDGNFNWRIVLNFDYIPGEQCVVVRKRKKFWDTSRRTAEKVKPELVVQLWDNNKFSADNYIGQYAFPMLAFEPPNEDWHTMSNVVDAGRRKFIYQHNKNCCCCCVVRGSRAKQYYVEPVQDAPRMSMFDQKHARGWWPVLRLAENGKREVTGKIELEYQLLLRSEADANPVGKGQRKVNKDPELDKPDRPKWDHYWLTSRCKAFQRFIWSRYKWQILFGTLMSLIIGALFYFVVHIPDILIAKAGNL